MDVIYNHILKLCDDIHQSNNQYINIDLFDNIEKIILENYINIDDNEKEFRNHFKMLIHLLNHLGRNEVNRKLVIINSPSISEVNRKLQMWFQEELLKVDNRTIGFKINDISKLNYESEELFNSYCIYKNNDVIKIFPSWILFNNQNQMIEVYKFIEDKK